MAAAEPAAGRGEPVADGAPLLRLHDWMADVRDVLGPGRRAVVWVQGCSLRCPGCIVPETWLPRAGRLVDPRELAREIVALTGVEGVTVSGGEPMEQAAAVAELVAAVRAAGLGVWVYSGYTAEELLARDDAAVRRILSLADVLVDGRYRREQADGAPAYRGSANQRVLALSGGAPSGAPVPALPAAAPRFQVTVDVSGRMVVVGVPPRGFLAALRESLERRGLRVAADPTWS